MVFFEMLFGQLWVCLLVLRVWLVLTSEVSHTASLEKTVHTGSENASIYFFCFCCLWLVVVVVVVVIVVVVGSSR